MKRALLLLALVGCQADLRVGVTAQASFVVDHASWDFGNITVGNSDRAQLVVSTEDDAGDTIIVTHTCGGDFTVNLTEDPVAITIAEPLVFTVDFAPSAAGAYSCDVTITGNDSTAQTVTLVGVGVITGPVPVLAAPSTGALDFGDIPTSITSAPQSIEIRNDGDADVTITGASFTAGGAELDVAVALGDDTVEPGTSQYWNATCSPTSDGAKSGTYVITTSAGDFTIEIACNGFTSSVYVIPVPAVFGEVLVGDVSTLSFDVHYTGSGDLAIDSVSIDNDRFTTNLDTSDTVPGGGSTSFTITFTPDTDGVEEGTLTIGTADGTVNVGLSGMAATGVLSVTPPDPVIDFGTVCVGQDSDAVRVSLRNVGTGAIDLIGLENLPGASHPFTGSSSTFPVTLPPGGALEAYSDERFSPLEAGDITGTFRIHTSIPGDETHDVPLHGVALAAEVGPTDAQVDFGSYGVGSPSEARDVGVVNCTAATITADVTLVGADADAFRILPGTATTGVDVDPMTSEAWSVQFTATHQGPHVATLMVSWTGGSVEIPLSGLGIADLVPEDEWEGTPIACSGGGGATNGLWLLALAALLVRRRVR